MELFQLSFLKRKSLMLALTGLLTSCTVGPNYHPPVHPIPLKYSTSIKKSPVKNINQFWWQSFKDPILVRLIDHALRGSSPDIEISYAKIRQARAELGVQKADYYPQINATGKVARDRLSGNSEILVAFPPNLVPLNYTDYKFGFDASWEIDFFGRTLRAVQASSARYHSAIENQYNASLSTAAEIANIYTQYRVYQQRINIANKTIASFGKTEKLVKLQIDAGVATNVDLKRVESEVLSYRSDLPFLHAESKASLAALAVLVGEFPESLFKELSKPAPIPVMSTKSLSLGVPSDLLRRRPDIRVAERNLAAATADIGVAVANQFPRFQLLSTFGSDSTISSAFFDAASKYWSLAPQVSIPLLKGGRLRNDVKAKEAARDIALATYKKSVLQALADVESSMIRYNGERARRQQIQSSFNELRSAFGLLTIQYKSGQIILTDVLDVERQLNQLNDKLAQSAGQETINMISLYKALGGSWLEPCKT